MKIYIRLAVILCILSIYSISEINANDYNIKLIPDSLKENAHAVYRNKSQHFLQKDKSSGTYTENRAITILDESGQGYANFIHYADKNRDLNKFSGVIRSVSGQVIKKISKKDLIKSTYSEGLASDGIMYIYKCTHSFYPFTIEYDYDVKFKNGIPAYPSFVPTPGYEVAVEKANYMLEVPSDVVIRQHIHKYNNQIVKKEEKGNQIFETSMRNIKAYKYEYCAPLADDFFPEVIFGPTEFEYHSRHGSFASWNDYGKWVSALLQGRDELPASEIAKVQDLIKNVPTEREKIKILYEYMQNNTRYVSVQLGIGGLQPIEASSVCTNRFGDCKGLSNLMKALLKAAGIRSQYVEIYLGKKKELYKDFASVNQSNHAILMVPLQSDTIWLECTNQTLPFGYIHDDIAGHDAIVINDQGEGGAEIITLPSYSSAENLSETTLILNIKDDNTAEGTITCTEHIHNYGMYNKTMMSNERKRQVDYINLQLKLPKVEINDIKAHEDKSENPSCTLTANIKTSDFINQTGNRLFVPVCPLYKGNMNKFDTKTRENDIYIPYGYSQKDSIVFTIPESYVLESQPKNIITVSPAGIFTAKMEKIDSTTIVYKQYLIINAGSYEKAKFKELKNFFATISINLKNRFVLRKE